MRTSRVDLAQRGHERGQIDGRLIQIVDRAVGVLPGQPLVHRPVEGIALGGMPHRQLHRERERQVRRELRQPLGLLRRLRRGPSDARQPGGQVVTEPIDVVIGPVRLDRIDRQIGPLRELPREQSTHQPGIGLDLVGMHLRRAHMPESLRTRAAAATEFPTSAVRVRSACEPGGEGLDRGSDLGGCGRVGGVPLSTQHHPLGAG